MTLGQRIRQERERQGRTQLEVANQAGIACGTLCDIEKGRCEPSLKTLRRIASALGIAPGVFMQEDYGHDVMPGAATSTASRVQEVKSRV